MSSQGERRAPLFTEEQVEYLERCFPDRSPALSDTEREVWYKAGQASVAAKVRHEYKLQCKEALRAQT